MKYTYGIYAGDYMEQEYFERVLLRPRNYWSLTQQRRHQIDTDLGLQDWVQNKPFTQKQAEQYSKHFHINE